MAACALSVWFGLGPESTWITQASAQEQVVLTNSLDQTSNCFGTVLLAPPLGTQQPGADQILSDLSGTDGVLRLGQTNQWRFYIITNELSYQNAAFILFDTNYAKPSEVSGTSRFAPVDFDMYVSADPTLLEFNPGAFSYAQKSTGPRQDELVVLNDASPSTYYIGVKCEASAPSGFGLAVIFSDLPFSEIDTNNRVNLRMIPLPLSASGSAGAPEIQLAFAVPSSPVWPRRVVVDMTLSQEGSSDLKATLFRSGAGLPLRAFAEDGALTNALFVFDDSDEQDIPNVLRTSGQAGLRLFSGSREWGPWVFQYANCGSEATIHEGHVILYPQVPSESGIVGNVLPGATREELFEVPDGASNMVLSASLQSGAGPVHVDFAPVWGTENPFNDFTVSTASPEGSASVDRWSNPPVSPGLWCASIRNSGPDEASLAVSLTVNTNSSLDFLSRFRLGEPRSIPDNAVSTYQLAVTNQGRIDSVQAGIRLDHPRLSDLQMTLISPLGTRVLLSSYRGGLSSEGMGHDIIVTNVIPVSSSGGPQVSTNVIDLRRTSGAISVDYDFYTIEDSMRIYYETNLIYDSGLVSGSGQTNVSYGPGAESFLTIVMNEGDNPEPDTAWYYTVTSVVPDFAFVELRDRALPMKFAPEPFDAFPADNYWSFSRAPEQPLSAFAGEPANGTWILEIQDALSGPVGSAVLTEFELGLSIRNETPLPLTLTNGIAFEGSLDPGQVQWVRIDASPWTAFATNNLTGSGPVTLVYSLNGGSWDYSEALTNQVILTNTLSDQVVLVAGGSPGGFQSGYPYYLGIINTNVVASTFSIQVEMSPVVTTLLNGPSLSRDGLAPGQSDFYYFAISDRAKRAQFELSGLTGDMVLLLKKDLSLPTFQNAQIISDNPGTSMELITLRQDSGPVPLSPGNWYVCAMNKSAAPVSYTVSARYWAATGTPFVVTNGVVQGGDLCLTWSSLPGAVYHLESASSLEQSWVPASPAIIAEETFTTYCMPMTNTASFFRVVEGLP